MCQPGWDGSFAENGYMYMYGLVPLLSTWNYLNVVNQLYPNTKWDVFLKKKSSGKNVCYNTYGKNWTREMTAAAAAAKSLQLCPTLWDPIDGSPPGSSVPGILQARILEWVAFPSPMHACMLSRFSCVWLCEPMDSSPPGSSVHGIF